MADDKKVKSGDIVRVLSVIACDGITYQPNQLVKDLPEEHLAVFLKSHYVTANQADIEYCQNKLKAKVVNHNATEPIPTEPKAAEPKAAEPKTNSDAQKK